MKKTKEIIWKDACTCSEEGTEWYTKERALEMAKEKYENNAITGGIILENNPKYIVVASTFSADLYSDITMIPKKFLVKIS